MAEDKVDEPKAEAPAATEAATDAGKDEKASDDAGNAAAPEGEAAKVGAGDTATEGGEPAKEAPPAFDLANKLTPLFLSTSSQEIFECKCDSEDGVTEEKPMKFIPLAKILEDMQMRAAVSDFSVVKVEMKVSGKYYS